MKQYKFIIAAIAAAIVVVIIIIGAVLVAGQGWYRSNQQSAANEAVETTPTGLANPASVYCEEHDGTVVMRTDETGGQYGVCVFADGSECDEWKYLRKECTPELQKGQRIERIAHTTDTSGWQTYQSDKYNFSMKIPQGWKVSLDYAPEGGAEGDIRVVPPVTGEYGNKPLFMLEIGSQWEGTGELLVRSNDSMFFKAESPTGTARVVGVYINRQYESMLNLATDADEILNGIMTSFKFIKVDASNWQTYRNEDYGFEFKYPKEWVTEIDGKIVWVRSKELDAALANPRYTGRVANFAVRIFNSLSELTSDNNITSLEEFLKSSDSQAVIVDNVRGFQISSGGDVGVSDKSIYLEHNNTIYLISRLDAGIFDRRTQADAIASTFKFTK